MAFGNKVMKELKIAYCTAVNDTLVEDDKNATNAALANPAARLSAVTAKYITATSCPAYANHTNARLVNAVECAPHQATHHPEAVNNQPPSKAAQMLHNRPKGFHRRQRFPAY